MTTTFSAKVIARRLRVKAAREKHKANNCLRTVDRFLSLYERHESEAERLRHLSNEFEACHLTSDDPDAYEQMLEFLENTGSYREPRQLPPPPLPPLRGGVAAIVEAQGAPDAR